jgi:hypothetical protein
VVSGQTGTRISASATLTVIDQVVTVVGATPSSLSLNAGDAASFTVVAMDGTAPFTYQWSKGGSLLVDGTYGGKVISGARTNALSLRGVLGADAGSYIAQVGNRAGFALSGAGVLTVVDPLLTG